MKIFKSFLSETLLVALVLILCMGLTVGAEGVIEWRSIFTQDYTGAKHGALPEENTPEIKSGMSAAIKGEALEVKSNNVIYWEGNNLASLNDAANSGGITCKNGNKVALAQEPIVHTDPNDNVTRTFTHTGSGDSSYLLDEIEGKKSLVMLTYIYPNLGGYRTNYYRFDIAQDYYKETDNTFDVEVEVFLKENDEANQYITFEYINQKSSLTTVKLDKATIDKNNIAGKWYTWKFSITGADFTKKAAIGAERLSFRMQAPTHRQGVWKGITAVSRISIKKTGGTIADYSENNKAVILPVAGEADFGNTRLSFDMMLPASELLTSEISYNTGANSMTVGIANENKKDVATLQIDSEGTAQKIYALTEEAGVRKKNLIYAGSILDQTLRYTLELNCKEKTYTVSIKSEDTELLEAPTTKYAIINQADVIGNALGRNFSIKHHPISYAMMASFDNIEMELQDDPDYLMAKADAEAIVLELPEGNLVSEGFALPTEGTVNGSSITWDSDTPGSIAVNAEGNGTIVTCGEGRVNVVLTVKANFNGLVHAIRYNVVVDEHIDHKKVVEDSNLIKLDIPSTSRVKEDFILPLEGVANASTISWATDNVAAISVSGSNATVTRGEFDIPVVLTAELTLGDFTVTKEFTITVAALSNMGSEVGNVVATEAAGKLSATVNVRFPVKEGNLSFIAVSIDPTPGTIRDRKVDTKVITSANKYSTVTFNVADLNKAAGDEVSYFLWDDSDISRVNNAPSVVTDFAIVDKAKGPGLSWTHAEDDNNAIEYYLIYRDGELYASFGDYIVDGNNKVSYTDAAVDFDEEHTYKVVPVDTNDLIGGESPEGKGKKMSMYYIDFNAKGSGKTPFLNGMADYQWASGTPNTDRYAMLEKVTDANGETTWAGTTPNKWIICATDKAVMGSDIRKYVLEIEYLDTEGKIEMVHNQVIPAGQEDNVTWARKSAMVTTEAMTNTRTWKTAIVRISNAQFKNSNNFSGADFGFHELSQKLPIYIRSVKIIPAELYD